MSQDIKNENCIIQEQHNYAIQKNFYNRPQNSNEIDTVDAAEGLNNNFQISIPISSFYGRNIEFKQIKTIFSQPIPEDQVHKVVPICGIAGIGKTECAKQFVHTYRSEFYYAIWINAETNIENSFKELSLKLNLSSNLDIQDIYRYLNQKTCIFVFDNVENMKYLKKYLPCFSTTICFLLTSQNKDWGKIRVIELKELADEDAIKVLQKILDYQISKEKLKQLAKTLDCIPLTLQMGASYILQQIKSDEFLGQQCSINQYIKAIESRRKLVLAEEFPASSTNEYSNSAYKAICFTLENITKKNSSETQLAFTILSILSYLNPDYIKYNHLLDIPEIKQNQDILKHSILILGNYSFIRVEHCRHLFNNYKKIVIHRLIQECLRYYHTQNKIDQYYGIVLQLLLQDEKDFHTIVHYESIIKHADEYFPIFYNFYLTNKSERLIKLIFEFGNKPLLSKLFEKLNINNDPLLLCTSVKMDQINVVNLLIDYGVDSNQRLENGKTALHFARSENCIKLLVSKGRALLNVKDNEGETPLYCAFRHRPWNITQCLVLHGADVNLCYEHNRTLLHILPSMTKFSNKELMKEKTCFLLKHGARVTDRDIFGYTPIQTALQENVPFLADIMNLNK